MASKTFTCSKDARIAYRASDGWNAGAGASLYNPTGTYSGYRYRTLMAFSLDWTSVTAINSAKLWVRTSTQNYVAFGSSPNVAIERLTATWSEGTATALSSSNAVIDPGPASTATGRATLAPGTAESTWKSVDITTIVRAWAPATVSGGGAAANYGIRLIGWDGAAESASAADVSEFYARETSSDPYITLDYSTNVAPAAPAVSCTPKGAITGATLTPTIAGDFTDSGDIMSRLDLQVSTDSTFATVSHWDASAGTAFTAVSSTRWSKVYAGSALSRGVQYYWRARVYDDTPAASAWSAAFAFKINSLPTGTKVRPIAAGGLALVWNLADLVTWTLAGNHAKARFDWTFADTDGGAQTAYQVKIATDAAGTAVVYDSGKVVSSATTVDATYAHVLGTQYYWQVTVYDAFDEANSAPAWTGYKVRWGQAIYEFAAGATSSGWAHSSAAVAANVDAAFLYRTATGAAGAGASAWAADIGDLTPAAYVNIAVRLTTDVAATASLLDSMTFSYTAAAIQPDRWTTQATTGADWKLDPSTRRYGTQALRCLVSTTTGNRFIYPYRKTVGDDVLVAPNTTYAFSAWVKTKAPLASGASLRLTVYAAGSLSTELASTFIDSTRRSTTSTAAYPEGWQRLLLTFKTGAATTSIRPMLHYLHNGTTAGDTFWWDAVKLEEGTVASAWTPGFVADAVVFDANGIAIDSFAGGIFRLRGTTGGSRDLVELGANGLVFGGDTTLYSDEAGVLRTAGTMRASSYDIGTSREGLRETSAGVVGLYTAASGAAQVNAKGLLLSGSYADPAPATAGIQFGADVNLYRSAANVLKTDDTFQAAALAIGANKVGRFVFLDTALQAVADASTTAASIGSTIVAEVTGLPATGVVAVMVMVGGRNSTVATSNIYATNYSDTGIAGSGVGAYFGKVASHYDFNWGLVETGGTNNRQFRYLLNWTGGTSTYYVRVVGYVTTE